MRPTRGHHINRPAQEQGFPRWVFRSPALGVLLNDVCWDLQENEAPLESLGTQAHRGTKVTALRCVKTHKQDHQTLP